MTFGELRNSVIGQTSLELKYYEENKLVLSSDVRYSPHFLVTYLTSDNISYLGAGVTISDIAANEGGVQPYQVLKCKNYIGKIGPEIIFKREDNDE